MSTFFLADRIKELSRTETTGPIVLDGAAPGFSSFDDFFASGDVVFYAITDNVDYEVGSGIYEPNMSDRVITRFPIRSSNLNSGPYYVNGDEANGPAGYYYPLYLTRSAAQSGVGFSDGPYTNVGELTFTEFPGITFYRPGEHQGYSPSVGISGSNYNSLSSPVDFDTGVKEVFVTYPGKTAVLNGYGLDSNIKEPKHSGVAFWRNESILNYSDQLIWDDTNNRLGIAVATPEHAIDVGGTPPNSIVRASGFIEGGSGIAFSGGAITYTGATASGGTQYEPFLRNENGSGSQGLIEFSGVVNQYIGIAKQTPGTVFAGPETDHCGTPPCDPDYPSFRVLTIDDLPLAELTTSGGFVIQKNLGLDSQSANIFPNNFAFGMVAIYAGSGGITYDSGILFDYNNNRLLVGGDASTDTPIYTLDARGTIGSQSGYFNQLLFTDDLIRVGTGAGTNEGNTTENFYIIGVGQNAGGGSTSGVFDGVFLGRNAGMHSETSSGIVMLGVGAGRSATDINESIGAGSLALRDADTVISGVAIGGSAGSGILQATHAILVGSRAGQSASGITNSAIVGIDAGGTTSGVTNAVLVGPNVGLNGSGLVTLVAIGDSTASQALNLNSAVAIGLQAGDGAASGLDVVWIGKGAGQDAVEQTHIVGIGTNAAKEASGIYNVYLGHNAGVQVSGDQNVEILSSGSANSWLGPTANNKINIERTIAGDSASKKVSIGNPSGVDPVATLTVEPLDADDAAFIVRVPGSGSATPPVQIQSGDGTTFYQVSNSGNVTNAGWSRPSGGVWLPDTDPTRDSGVGGHMLWNDGNTLVWNGSPVGGAGSFTSWDFLTEDGGGTITDGQQIIISGVSGIQVIASGVGNRNWTIDGGTLSGLIVELSGQVAASEYSFDMFASGVGANNNDPKTMLKNSVLAMSGVSGINIDFTDQNNSGIFTIGYDISNTYSFNVTNGDVAEDIITNTETVTISGVSGVRVEFEDIVGGGFFRIAAPELSGVLQSGIDDNTGYLSNEHGPISVSGVSGVATWASGEFGRLGLGSTPGTSGLILQDSAYMMDPDGSGNLRMLNFPNNGGRILIRAEADANAIGQSWQGGIGSIFIGSGVGIGAASTDDDYVTAIGTNAFQSNKQGDRTGMVILGYQAFENEPESDTIHSIAIGRRSLSYCSGNYNIAIGYDAGLQSSTTTRHGQYCIDIGYQAGHRQDGGSGYIINIGRSAGRNQFSGDGNISIGQSAGAGQIGGSELYQNHHNTDTIFIGRIAGYGAKETGSGIIIGDAAGYSSSGLKSTIFIGDNAGSWSSGNQLPGSIAIGTEANRSSFNSDSVIAIGTEANRQCVDNKNVIAIGEAALWNSDENEGTVAIGWTAGYEVSGVNWSILMGYGAGRERSGSNSIILSVEDGSPSPYDCSWTSHDKDQVLDIGHHIQGTMEPCNIHLGAELNNTYRQLTDINVSTFSITPDDQNDSAFVLWLNSTNGTSSNQAAGLMKTQTRDGTAIQSTLNEVINSEGFLRLPRATGVTGSYPNRTLLADGQEVKPGAGVMAVYEFSPSDRGIAVSLNDGGAYVWYKLPVTTVL